MENPLSGIDFASVLPFTIAVCFGIVALLLEVFQRPSASRGYIGSVTAAGLGAAGLAAWWLRDVDPVHTFSGSLALDAYGMTLAAVVALGGAIACLTAPSYLEKQGVDRGEFYGLIAFATSGLMLMGQATSFITFFVALEIASVAAYGIAAFQRRSTTSVEAGLKYFLLGAFASALLLYGITLLYGATGAFTYAEIAAALTPGASASAEALANGSIDTLRALAAGFDPAGPDAGNDYARNAGNLPLASLGAVLILVAFFIKVAAAPFHMWAPDAYTGAPAPGAGFLASAVKVGAFAALGRIVFVALEPEVLRLGTYGWSQILAPIALLSIVFGNMVALTQASPKRMLAWSSVAHSGYLVLALASVGFTGGPAALSVIVFYGAAYVLATGGAFGVLSLLARRGSDAGRWEDLDGLSRRHPWLAACFSVFLLSSAGVPLTAGFIGKFLAFGTALSGANQGGDAPGATLLMVAAILGIAASVAGAWYYLRGILHMYGKPSHPDAPEPSVTPAARLAIVLAALLTLWFGIFPGAGVELATLAVQGLAGAP